MVAPQTAARSCSETLNTVLIPLCTYCAILLLSRLLLLWVFEGYDAKCQTYQDWVLKFEVTFYQSPVLQHLPKYFNGARNNVVRDLFASLRLLPSYTQGSNCAQQELSIRIVQPSSRKTESMQKACSSGVLADYYNLDKGSEKHNWP